MKHFLFKGVILAMTASLSPAFIAKAESTYSSQCRPIELKRLPDNHTSGRKRLPSKDNAFCWYTNKEVYVEFYNPEGVCNIEITGDLDFDIVETFDSSSTYAVNVGTANNLSITITTESGVIYYGIMD